MEIFNFLKMWMILEWIWFLKLRINKHSFLKTLKNVGYTLLKTNTILKV
jgi:hypothetical protein